MLLNVGGGGLVTTFRPILAALNYKFQIVQRLSTPFFGLAAANNKLQQSFQILLELQLQLLIAFGINILLVASSQDHEGKNPLLLCYIMVQQVATVYLLWFYS